VPAQTRETLAAATRAQLSVDQARELPGRETMSVFVLG